MVSPGRHYVESSPSSFSCSSSGKNLYFTVAPANTPNNNAASRSTNDSTGHTSGEPQCRIVKDIGIVRMSLNSTSTSEIERSRRPDDDDDIRGILYSSQKVSTWLNRMPSISGSLFGEAAEPSIPGVVPTQESLIDFGVSHFNADRGYDPLKESENQSRNPRRPCNRNVCVHRSGRTDGRHDVQWYSGQVRSYPKNVNGARPPNDHPPHFKDDPLNGHIPYFHSYPAQISGYPSMYFQNYEPMHRLAMRPFCYCRHPIGVFPRYQRGQEKVATPLRGGPQTLTTPKPQATPANRVLGQAKKFTRMQMSRYLKERSVNHKASNSSVKVVTLAVF